MSSQLVTTQCSPTTGIVDTFPEGRVALHQLCHQCQQLCHDWDLSDTTSILPKTKNDFAHSLVEELGVSSKSCHCCSLIYKPIEKILARGGQLQRMHRAQIFLGEPGTSLMSTSIHRSNYAIKLCLGEGSPRHIGHIQICQYHDQISDNHPSCLSMQSVSVDPCEYDAELLLKWLHTCLDDHPGCREYARKATPTTERPTRILEVGSHDIKLRCDIAVCNPYSYTTLSHVWGTDEEFQLRLTKARLQEFEQGIAITSLPAIFRQAVVLTTLLKIQYLWIDSLCIIQDSQPDWQIEASRMAVVYGHSTCNLACPFRPNSKIAKRDPRPYLPCIVHPATQNSHGLYVAPDERFSKYTWDDPQQWALSSRAWVLQEHLLSPRTIFFGRHNLKWECAHERRDEWLGLEHTGYRKKDFLFEAVEKQDETFRRSFPIRSISQKTSFVELWESVVHDYRSRYLTNSGDRTMAFAGIARAAHNITKMTYLAGVWDGRIVHTLLWHVGRSPVTNLATYERHVYEPVVHAVPSWSWFSVPIDPEIILYFPFSKNTRYSYELTDVYLATLSSFQWPQHALNVLPTSSYYDFKDLRLALRVQTIATNLIWRYERVTGGNFHDALRAQKDLSYRHFHIFLDIAETHPHRVLLCLLVEVQAERPYAFGGKVYRELAGLLLTPGLHPDTWRRLGMWNLRVSSEWNQQGLLQSDRSVFNLLGGVESEITLL